MRPDNDYTQDGLHPAHGLLYGFVLEPVGGGHELHWREIDAHLAQNDWIL